MATAFTVGKEYTGEEWKAYAFQLLALCLLLVIDTALSRSIEKKTAEITEVKLRKDEFVDIAPTIAEEDKSEKNSPVTVQEHLAKMGRIEIRIANLESQISHGNINAENLRALREAYAEHGRTISEPIIPHESPFAI